MKECQTCKKCYADDVETCPIEGMPTMHTISGEPVLEGKYHLETRIGQGGMGVVYKAKHAYLKTSHAIKIILPDLVGNDPQLVQRFRQEALAAAAIRHQNVVGVSDYGVAQGTMPFLVMEFVEGEDLHDFLDREKRLSPEKAFALTAAICRGIGAAHSQGIVHRDMKPLNIMLLKGKTDMSEAVKILDFGLAKIKSGELLGSFIQAKTTGLMGSPFYMAPEQWSDEELDGRSDIYSIGVMLFQMLTGDVPFKGSSIPAIMKKHLTDPPPSFADFGVELDPEIEKVVHRTLEKDREKRTPSVEKLVEELGEAIGIVNQNQSGATEVTPSVSTLKVLTNPPGSEVYINDVRVGSSKDDGWLLIEGLKTGNHSLRVTHDRHQDWVTRVVCDGTTKQIVADLKPGLETGGIPMPTDATVAFDRSISNDTPPNLSVSQESQPSMQQTAHQHHQTGKQDFASQPPAKNWMLSPLVLSVIGISGLLLLTAIGGVGAYFAGVFDRATPGGNQTPTPTSIKAVNEVTPIPMPKAEMIEIPGGEFTMGRNDGLERERPEHKVKVESFWMDKTEITNAEYYKFVEELKHKTPAHFVNGKPIGGTEMQPVKFVSLADAEKFAEWRSKRDDVKYRLPTEIEWEYAARSGSENRLYPWGDRFEEDSAVIGRRDDTENVGGREKGANIWGVQDLVGNVWEWTSTSGVAYPKSPVQISTNAQVIRGGSYFDKPTGKDAITSTYRGLIKPDNKEKSLGFRLVR